MSTKHEKHTNYGYQQTNKATQNLTSQIFRYNDRTKWGNGKINKKTSTGGSEAVRTEVAHRHIQ